MSWATCYSGSNNVYFDSPPMMNDGRNYASWQPEAVINERIQKQEGIKTNWGYRQFLQHNSNDIRKYNTAEACYALGLYPYYNTNNTPSSNVPFQFKNVFDTNNPGFWYNYSDLKIPYLSREQLNARINTQEVIIKEN